MFGENREKVLGEFYHFQNPVLAIAHPECTIKHADVLPFKVSVRNPEKYPEYEKLIDNYVESVLFYDDRSGNYGFLEYGSGPHFYYRALNKTEGKEHARFVADAYYRYANHNYGGGEYWWNNYLRSGSRK